MTKFKKYWPKIVVILIVVNSVAIFAWVFSAEWRYRNYPSTCPFAAYLPEGAMVTKCEYVGSVDFTVDFQAKGTRSDMDSLIQGVRGDLTNAKTYPETGTLKTGTDYVSNNQVKMSADNGILANFFWTDGIILMFYHDG